MRQQTHRSILPTGLIVRSRRERVLRHAFVNAPGALDCRPHPRTAFDNAARRDNPTSPWQAFADPLRAAVAAAVAQGGPCVEETETRVTHAVLALLEYVLEPLPESAGSEIGYITLVHDEAEALEAQTIARAIPTAEHVELALRVTEE